MTWRDERVRTVVVDGETFVVTPRPAEPGVYDLDWTSGRNRGYGFTSARSDRARSTPAELEQAIRDFLGQVDPETGHIE